MTWRAESQCLPLVWLPLECPAGKWHGALGHSAYLLSGSRLNALLANDMARWVTVLTSCLVPAWMPCWQMTWRAGSQCLPLVWLPLECPAGEWHGVLGQPLFPSSAYLLSGSRLNALLANDMAHWVTVLTSCRVPAWMPCWQMTWRTGSQCLPLVWLPLECPAGKWHGVLGHSVYLLSGSRLNALLANDMARWVSRFSPSRSRWGLIVAMVTAFLKHGHHF